MAFKPSMRKKSDTKFKEPDMIVVMNLMVCLIPLLLSAAEFVKLGNIEINLPESSGGGGGSSSNDQVEQQKKLDIKVLITLDGFTLQHALAGGIEQGPTEDSKATIPVEPGDFNPQDGTFYSNPANPNYYQKMFPFQKLNDRLSEIKRDTEGAGYIDSGPDFGKVQITAGEGVPYQVLVRTMDMVKVHYKDGQPDQVLFPEISLGVVQ